MSQDKLIPVIDHEIQAFLQGEDDMEHVVCIEARRDTNLVDVFRADPVTMKRKREQVSFRPFLFMRDLRPLGLSLYNGNTQHQKNAMQNWGVSIKKLRITDDNGAVVERLKNGYYWLVETNHNSGWQALENFFKNGGLPLPKWGNGKAENITFNIAREGIPDVNGEGYVLLDEDREATLYWNVPRGYPEIHLKRRLVSTRVNENSDNPHQTFYQLKGDGEHLLQGLDYSFHQNSTHYILALHGGRETGVDTTDPLEVVQRHVLPVLWPYVEPLLSAVDLGAKLLPSREFRALVKQAIEGAEGDGVWSVEAEGQQKRFFSRYTDLVSTLYPKKAEKKKKGEPTEEEDDEETVVQTGPKNWKKVKLTYQFTTAELFHILKPEEQFMIQTGIRYFKGYNRYPELHKLVFDLETTGLEPKIDRIEACGLRDNRGYEETLFVSKDDDDAAEKMLIRQAFAIMRERKAPVICGHNIENFDWDFFLTRLEVLGIDVKEIPFGYDSQVPLRRQPATLKLGGETEHYEQTRIQGGTVLDTIHAVRRAMAIDSDLKSARLKNVCQAKKINKLKKTGLGRVYVEGGHISTLRRDPRPYVYDKVTGRYAVIPEGTVHEIVTLMEILQATPWTEEQKGALEMARKDKTPAVESLLEGDISEEIVVTTGAALVRQYLLDDLWETEQVDEMYNEEKFQLAKLLPTSFVRTSTMGGAGAWNLLMTAWSYRENVAIPIRIDRRRFTGGLSRTFMLGKFRNVYKFDFSGLYPSIQLEHDVFPDVDVTGVLPRFLAYFKNSRDIDKKRAKDMSLPESERLFADAVQKPKKVLNNSMFGSSGSPFFNWADTYCAERITCSGRQYLRQMVSFFQQWGCEPIVCDSVTGPTPIYLRYPNGTFDIQPIEDLFDENSPNLDDSKLRDYASKGAQILTRGGWSDIKYVYRHGTHKNIHQIDTMDRMVQVTEDHSLFQDGKEVKPKQLHIAEKIDIYDLHNIDINQAYDNLTYDTAFNMGALFAEVKWNESEEVNELYFTKNGYKRVPCFIYSLNQANQQAFLDGFFRGSKIAYDLKTVVRFSIEDQVLMAGLSWLIKNVGFVYTMKSYPAIQFDLTVPRRVKPIKKRSDTIWKNRIVTKRINKSYVYDVSTGDGTFIGGIGGIILHNTDGINMQVPEMVNVSIQGRELDQPVSIDLLTYDYKGKTYKGVDALVTRYNVEILGGGKYMKLDNDGSWPSAINISRKNYANLEEDGHIKYVGNSLKSKAMAAYIREFLERGIRLLLEDKGEEFAEAYYAHLEDIYMQRIPLLKIANVARVKQTIADYKNRGTDKNGRTKARQIHMELLDQLGITPNLGDTVYYINSGDRKSHSFTSMKKIKQVDGTIKEEYRAYLIPEAELEADPTRCGSYNVARYVDAFNSRVKGLLAVYCDEVRRTMLVSDPTKRCYYTSQQLKLIQIPNPNPQDSIDGFFNLEASEVEFWRETGHDPSEIFESGNSEKTGAKEYRRCLERLTEKVGRPIRTVQQNWKNDDLVLRRRRRAWAISTENPEERVELPANLVPYAHPGSDPHPYQLELYDEWLKYKNLYSTGTRWDIEWVYDLCIAEKGELRILRQIASQQ